MATCLDIVTRACRKIGIVAQDEPLTADMAAASLASLNDMLHAWKLSGIDLALTADLALSDTFPMAPEFREGTIYSLASRIAPDNEAVAGFDADDFFRKIQAAYVVIADVPMPSGLIRRRWTP